MAQTHGGDDGLIATFLFKSADSEGLDDCPAFYRTNRASFIGQGKRGGEGIASQLRNLADNETFAEFPEVLMDQFARWWAKER